MASKRSGKFAEAFGGNGSEPEEVSWDVATESMIGRLVTSVVDAGGAVMFGTTRDGGAYTLTFFHDDVPKKNRTQYEGSEERLAGWLEYWVNFWEGVVDEQRSPKAKKGG